MPGGGRGYDSGSVRTDIAAGEVSLSARAVRLLAIRLSA